MSKILNKFKESKLVKDVFYGIRPASTGLILAAAFSVIQISLINMKSDSGFVGYFRWPALGLAALVFALYKWKKPHPIVLIILSGLLGVIFKI